MIEQIPDDPVGILDRKSGQWKATEDWRCPMSDGRTLLVRKGTLSDGVSAPRIIWPLIGPYEPTTFGPALFHDCVYRAELVNREFADDEFRRLLLLYGMSKAKAYWCWKMVRMFGWMTWLGHSEYTVKQARQFCEIVRV